MNRRERLPDRRVSIAYVFNFENQSYRASAGYFLDGRLAEVFFDVGKAGSALQAHADAVAVMASLLLQYGIPVETIKHSVGGPLAVALDYFSKMAVMKGGQ
jgi:ribonucleoside-diphosphate reductase alpha chain